MDNKNEGMGGIIKKTIEKGMLIDPGGKSPTMSDIFDISCEEVMKHLKTFWLEPSNLAINIKARMVRHLKKIKCEKCLKKFAKIMEEYPTEESRKNEIERMGQEQINQGKPLLPERCADWEGHAHALNLDPEKWTCADNKACCIHWLKLVMGKLADDGMRRLLFWIECREVSGEYEIEVIMEIMANILSKNEKHKVMMTIIDAYYDSKENWVSWVNSGKSYRGQTDYLRMKECKERLSKAFGLTDDALKMYDTARKKRLARLARKERRAIFKQDKSFSLPQFCSDISSHVLEVEKIFAKLGSSFISLLYGDIFPHLFGKEICCRHTLGLILKELLRNEGLENYINYIIATKRILKFRQKQLRIYLASEIKILNECNHNKVMECLGGLYTETGLKLQKNAQKGNCPVPKNDYDYISYFENQEELHKNKERLSVLTRLIRKLT